VPGERRCGYCGGVIDHARDIEAEYAPGRCPCGRRAVTRLPGGVLTHAEGCDGTEDVDTGCYVGFGAERAA
jgi:hypothetical protein